MGYLVAILSILVFGFMSIILMPFLISLTKQALHRCAKCLNEVKSNSYFGFSSLEDKVITCLFNILQLVSFEIGSFGILLTRRYLLYIVMTLTCGMAIYLFLLNEAEHSHEMGKSLILKNNVARMTNLQWNDFRRDSGYYAYLASP